MIRHRLDLAGEWTPTASQTVGPFFHIGLSHLEHHAIGAIAESDDAVTVSGQILDGDGVTVPDAVIEIWSADADGRYDESGSSGFARIVPGPDGRFSFRAMRPGCVVDALVGEQAPHLAVLIFMRGLLKPLLTRMYFPAEPRNEGDPVLTLVPANRRQTLVARPAAGKNAVVWDIRLQGENETVFLQC